MRAPAVPPMSPQTRQRIRRRIVRQATSGSRSRGWVPAVVAGTAVATVVAVGIAGSQVLRSGDDNGPVVQASNSPSTPARTTTTAPGVIMLDRGAPSASHLETVKQWCLYPNRSGGATVEFARRVLYSGDGMQRVITAVVLRTGPGKYWACFYNVDHRLINGPWHPPSKEHPIRRIAPSGTAYIYLVHPSIARMETRVRWPAKGITNPWARAVIVNGVAYGANIGRTPTDQAPGLPVFDIRAYDAAGKQIPVRPGT